MAKSNSELLERAYAIAESHFFSDDECQIAWEPFEDWEQDELQDQVHALAQTILLAMQWSQDNED
jgi:hypothetical protein